MNRVLYSHLFHRRDLSQDVAPLAAPDHQPNHSQGEENWDKDEDRERVIRGIDPHPLLYGAVGKKVLVYADDVALHQRIGPVAVDDLGLGLCAEGEEVVLTEERDRQRRCKRVEESNSSAHMCFTKTLKYKAQVPVDVNPTLTQKYINYSTAVSLNSTPAFKHFCGLASNNLSISNLVHNPSW